jgi:hypothetical protein
MDWREEHWSGAGSTPFQLLTFKSKIETPSRPAKASSGLRRERTQHMSEQPNKRVNADGSMYSVGEALLRNVGGALTWLQLFQPHIGDTILQLVKYLAPNWGAHSE